MAKRKATSKAKTKVSDQLEQSLLTQSWDAWKRKNPNDTKRERAVFMFGFQIGLLAGELKDSNETNSGGA